MRVIYLAHPLSGDIEGNLARAKRWYAWAIKHFAVAVVADWMLTCSVLDDRNVDERRLGMSLNEPLLERCDEIWLVGGRTSAGMNAECELAYEYGLAVRDLTFLGEEPPHMIPLEIKRLIAAPR